MRQRGNCLRRVALRRMTGEEPEDAPHAIYCRHTDAYTYMHTYAYTCTYKHAHIYLHLYILDTCIHLYACILCHTCIHTHWHAHTHREVKRRSGRRFSLRYSWTCHQVKAPWQWLSLAGFPLHSKASRVASYYAQVLAQKNFFFGKFDNRDLTGGSTTTSVTLTATVDTKHVPPMACEVESQRTVTVSALQTSAWNLNRHQFPNNFRFSKNSVPRLKSQTVTVHELEAIIEPCSQAKPANRDSSRTREPSL